MRETTKLRLALVFLLLVMLPGLAFPRPLAAALDTIADMASYIYKTLEGPPRGQLSPSILQWEEIYKTYTEATLPAKRLHLSRLLKAGMNGDIHALAAFYAPSPGHGRKAAGPHVRVGRGKRSGG